MQGQAIIIGSSDDCEAEYGLRAQSPVTVLLAWDGEIYSVEGFNTLAAAKGEYAGDDTATYLYL